jgi:hypothetical protein
MADLNRLELSDIVSLGAPLRAIGAASGSQTSMEDAAKKVVDLVYTRLTKNGGTEPALVLARLYKTHAYGALDPELQAFARAALGGVEPAQDAKCLVLLSTRGIEHEWNDRHRSTGHRAIPLPDPEFVSRLPMVAEVLKQFGLNVREVLRPDAAVLSDLERRQFDVFLVPRAAGAGCIPAQEDFVLRWGVDSVLAFGGVLSSGDLFVTILFSRVPISKQVADMFAPLALSVKLSLMPHVRGRLLNPEGRP